MGSHLVSSLWEMHSLIHTVAQPGKTGGVRDLQLRPIPLYLHAELLDLPNLEKWPLEVCGSSCSVLSAGDVTGAIRMSQRPKVRES